MCWSGKNERKIAKDDIKVFKVVRGDKKSSFFKSAYYHFIYRLGFVYSSRIRKESDLFDTTRIKINNGIHSYSCDCKVAVTGGDYIFIRSCTNKETLDTFSKYTLFYQEQFYVLDCIIPKRSAYYINICGEIVSSRLKIIKATKL